ncbi:hypothetical protein B0H15DRAFT_942592 [Mycena belliarum]|uniref:Uncharacterized protein n=1 Tax=Mycena belliarum TaxID=1033014 RepID=A0AAD6XVU6_9AGAR|nr:hypothetical protein B0H15DRAFT_942592 [Mycena belliae]
MRPRARRGHSEMGAGAVGHRVTSQTPPSKRTNTSLPQSRRRATHRRSTLLPLPTPTCGRRAHHGCSRDVAGAPAAYLHAQYGRRARHGHATEPHPRARQRIRCLPRLNGSCMPSRCPRCLRVSHRHSGCVQPWRCVCRRTNGTQRRANASALTREMHAAAAATHTQQRSSSALPTRRPGLPRPTAAPSAPKSGPAHPSLSSPRPIAAPSLRPTPLHSRFGRVGRSPTSVPMRSPRPSRSRSRIGRVRYTEYVRT